MCRTPAMKNTPEPTRILGHDIAKPRLTAAGVFWCMLYLGGPVFLLGMALDALAQWWLGWCLGLWCML
jgi:hypothetical protein